MEKLTRQEAFSLSIDAYHRRSSDERYTAEEREEGFKQYLADLNKDYRRNKVEIFEIIEETVNQILPNKVNDLVRNFAEFKDFAENTTVKFKAKSGKIKAVDVALGGRVQRFRLDKGSFMLKTEAIQCKVYEEYERVQGGMVDWNELINMVIDAIMESILKKVYATLISLASSVPTANKGTSAGFDKTQFDRIINTVKSYGTPIIVGTPLAVSTIPLDSTASEQDKLDIRNKGYLGMYRGISVVEIPNSFTDETNTATVFDEGFLFVLPSGSEKVVKVAMEGGFHIDEERGSDWTFNYEGYQKVGVGLLAVNNIGIYENTSL